MTDSFSVALIGAGSMGGALLRGWVSSNVIDKDGSAIFDPAASDDMAQFCKASHLRLNPAIEGAFDALVIAIKPQVAAAILPNYRDIAKDAVSISVMAGKSVASIKAALGDTPLVARTMPNLPASIGKGVTGLFAEPGIDAPQRIMIEKLMAAAGETIWVPSEEQIDFVTAVSGSGPAYYFLLTEALEEAGVALGLSKEAAAKLARATLSGAGALVADDPRTPGEIRIAVTSPGGTTEAALNVFDGDKKALRKLVHEAVKAAADRGAELMD